MRSTYLIAGAIVLALVAAGVLFGTDFFRKNPFDPDPDEAQVVMQMNETAAASGGYAATFGPPTGKNWQLTSGHRLERFSVGDKGAVLARLTSSVPLDPAKLLEGLYVQLPPQFAQQMNGRKVEVGIVARTPSANGFDQFSIIYLTQQAGNSGWRTFQTTGRFRLFKFEFNVPHVAAGYENGPVIAIHGDAAGHGRGVELLGIYVRPLP